MSINKTILIFFVLFHITLQAPRSLRNGSEDPIPTTQSQKECKSEPLSTHKPSAPAPKQQPKQPAGSMDWTVTTTADLNSSINTIKEILSQTLPGESLSEEKKALLKSLDTKKAKTQKEIHQAKQKGDSSYNSATFSVNRLSMSVNWYKSAIEILNTRLSKICYEKNLTYKDSAALEQKCKESLFYEVYAHASSSYPEPLASPNICELESIVNAVIKEHLSTPNKTQHNPEGDSATKVWTEIKEVKAHQVEKSIAAQRNIEQLKHDLSIAQKSLLEHKNALDKAIEQNKNLTQKVEKVSSERLEKAIQVSSLEQKISNLEKAHAAATSKLSQEIQKLGKEIAEREKTIEKLNSQKSKNLEQLQELEKSITKLKQENLSNSIELKTANSRRDQALDALKTQKDSLGKKLEKYNQQQMEKEKEILLKQIKIKQLEEDLKRKSIELETQKLSLNSQSNSPTKPQPTPPVTFVTPAPSTPTETKVQPTIPAVSSPSAPIPTSPTITPAPTPSPIPTQIQTSAIPSPSTIQSPIPGSPASTPAPMNSPAITNPALLPPMTIPGLPASAQPSAAPQTPVEKGKRPVPSSVKKVESMSSLESPTPAPTQSSGSIDTPQNPTKQTQSQSLFYNIK